MSVDKVLMSKALNLQTTIDVSNSMYSRTSIDFSCKYEIKNECSIGTNVKESYFKDTGQENQNTLLKNIKFQESSK